MPKTTYYWDELSDNVVAEYEDGVLSASYTHEPELYGNLLSQNRNGVTSYYHYDGRGDTVALTDDSGNITGTKEYDAWGNVIASTGSTTTPYQFAGKIGYQSSLPGIFSPARVYCPTLARWCSGQLTKTPPNGSPYLYLDNSPIEQDKPFWGPPVPMTDGNVESQVIRIALLENKVPDFRLTWISRIARNHVPDRIDLKLETWQLNTIQSFVGVFSFDEVANPIHHLADVNHIPTFRGSIAKYVSHEDNQGTTFKAPIGRVCSYREHREIKWGFNPRGESVPESRGEEVTGKDLLKMQKAPSLFQFELHYQFVDLSMCGTVYRDCCKKSGKCVFETITSPWGTFDSDVSFPQKFEVNTTGVY